MPQLKLSDNVLRGIWQVGFKSRKAYRVNSIGEGYTSPPANILETAVVFYFFFLTSSSYEVLMRFLSGSYQVLMRFLSAQNKFSQTQFGRVPKMEMDVMQTSNTIPIGIIRLWRVYFTVSCFLVLLRFYSGSTQVLIRFFSSSTQVLMRFLSGSYEVLIRFLSAQNKFAQTSFGRVLKIEMDVLQTSNTTPLGIGRF